MTALADLKQYLGTTLTGSHSDAVLSSVLEVEKDAQAKKVRPIYQLADLILWDEHPAMLREAIMRRCARNLALRKSPLGLQGDAEVGILRVTSNDSEIKRLESGFLKVSVG